MRPDSRFPGRQTLVNDGKEVSHDLREDVSLYLDL